MFKDFIYLKIYLVLERREGRKKERGLAHNLGMCPDWESNQ